MKRVERKPITSVQAGAQVSYGINPETGRLTVTATPVSALLGWPVNPPTISGTPRVGQTLTATASGATSYQWLADGVAISGATASTFVLTNTQSNALITVSVGLAGGGSATSNAIGPVSPFASIAADGFSATTAASPSDLSLLPFTVVDEGFVLGTATTRSRTEYLTKRINQDYPNQNSFTSGQQATSDYLLATSTVAGATVSSTLASPKVFGAWLMPEAQLVGDTINWAMDAWHYYGIDCVWVRGNDGTTQTPWQIVFTKSLYTLAELGCPFWTYQGALDVSGLADPSDCWLEGKAFPRIGGAGSVLSSEENYAGAVNRREFTRVRFRRNVTAHASPVYIAVSDASGNDSTGVTSTTEATARATPCKTGHGAIVRANSLLGDTRGCLDGLHIVVMDTATFGSAPFTSYKQNVGAIYVTRASNVARNSAVASITGQFRPYLSDHAAGVTEGQVIFKDMKLVLGTSGSFTGEAAYPLHVQIWNCTVDDSSLFGAQRDNSHLSYFGPTFTAHTSMLGRSGNGAIRKMIGVVADLVNSGFENWVTRGCVLTRPTSTFLTDASRDGHICVNNRFVDPDPASITLQHQGTVSGGDLGAFIYLQNEVVRLRHSTQPTVMISADGEYGNVVHGILGLNTVPAGRHNLLYDEHATVRRYHKFFRVIGELADQLNTKDQVFAASIGITNPELRRGNKAFTHGVGCIGNYSRLINAAGALPGYAQLYPGIGSVIAGGAPGFIDDRSDPAGAGSGSSGGNYALSVGAAARGLVPAGHFLTPPEDLAGATRGTGVQPAGAYA